MKKVIVMMAKKLAKIAVTTAQARTPVEKSLARKIMVTALDREAGMAIVKKAVMPIARTVVIAVTISVATAAITVETVVMAVITIVSIQYSSQKLVNNNI